jgi:hypothetical protein
MNDLVTHRLPEVVSHFNYCSWREEGSRSSVSSAPRYAKRAPFLRSAVAPFPQTVSATTAPASAPRAVGWRSPYLIDDSEG